MTQKEIVESSKRLSRVMENFSQWDAKDQYFFLALTESYYENLMPIIDKYDTMKPKKFIIKRLDES